MQRKDKKGALLFSKNYFKHRMKGDDLFSGFDSIAAWERSLNFEQ